jgi:transposase
MENKEEQTRPLTGKGLLHPNPEKVQTELVAQSSFCDARDLMQMKYEMLRSVSVDQQPVAVAAQKFGLSRVAYYHTRGQYEKHGLAGLLPHRRGPKHPHKFKAEVMAFIDTQLNATGGPPDWELLSHQVESQFGITVHPRSVERAMKLKKNSKQ